MQNKTTLLRLQASLCLVGAIVSGLAAADAHGWVQFGLFLLLGSCVSAFVDVMPKYVAACIVLFLEQEQAKAQR